VADSITWRRFCWIRLDGLVAHPTTLMKLTTRCGTAPVDGCNEALLAKAAEAKLLLPWLAGSGTDGRAGHAGMALNRVDDVHATRSVGASTPS
jgi:hypothetical protein